MNEDILASLKAKVPEAEPHPQPVKPYVTAVVPAARWLDTVTALKDMGFGYLDMLTAIDWKGPTNIDGYVKDPNPNPFLPEGATPETDAPVANPAVKYRETFEVVAVLSDLGGKRKVAIKTEVPRETPSVASLVSLFKTADWQEREVFDLLGVRFEGHPNLTKILTPDFMEGHPLRKDYVHKKDKYD